MGDDGERFCSQSCDKKPAPTPTSSSKSSGLGIGPIVGIAVGGVAVLALIAALIILRCRHNRIHNTPPAPVPNNAVHQPGMAQVTPHDPKVGGHPAGPYGGMPMMPAGSPPPPQFQQFQQPMAGPYGNSYQHQGMPIAAAAPPLQHSYAGSSAPYSTYGSDRPLSAHSQSQYSSQGNALAMSNISAPSPPHSPLPLLSDYSPHHTSTPLTTIASPPPGAAAAQWQPPQRQDIPGVPATGAPQGFAGATGKQGRETMYAEGVHRQSSSYGASSSGTVGPSGGNPMSPDVTGQELPPPLYSERSAR